MLIWTVAFLGVIGTSIYLQMRTAELMKAASVFM
jgi:hypothetical protein